MIWRNCTIALKTEEWVNFNSFVTTIREETTEILRHHTTTTPDANEEAKGKDEPPKPSVLVPHEVSVAFDDQRPLGKRETETGQGAVACRDRVAETHEKHEANL